MLCRQYQDEIQKYIYVDVLFKPYVPNYHKAIQHVLEMEPIFGLGKYADLLIMWLFLTNNRVRIWSAGKTTRSSVF